VRLQDLVQRMPYRSKAERTDCRLTRKGRLCPSDSSRRRPKDRRPSKLPALAPQAGGGTLHRPHPRIHRRLVRFLGLASNGNEGTGLKGNDSQARVEHIPTRTHFSELNERLCRGIVTTASEDMTL
jgi:hypothetical protein